MTQTSAPAPGPADPIPSDRQIRARPLTPGSFAPFGHVARPGLGAVRMIRDGHVRLSKSDTGFAHLPEAAEAKLDFYEVAQEKGPLIAGTVERHLHSAQMFSPMTAARWLVAVWPDGPEGAPLAFVAGPQDVVTYAPGVWHHGIVALDRAACFASLMWKTGDAARDTEFRPLAAPWAILWPDAMDCTDTRA
ncbi:ureidoglycolate lyase [Pseudooceanicola algae]|uniref:Ureidoglycolate lyase n=1 Tax=Pseudooceanicola algae TaxID=1537215 RepID=A0A418SBP4_9RHOB|nr:ureidoglycolate lyase [Pseudooceanicola algae]QPM92451.1 Ureidoglycolate lyase [Pseudooceanicola algae]